MDSVSSFFQWDEQSKQQPQQQKKQATNNSISFVPDNLSGFFTSEDQPKQSSRASSFSGGVGNGPASGAPAGAAASDTKTATTTSISSNKSFMSTQLTDILVEKLFLMALPPTNQVAAGTIEERVAAGKSRPTLSVPIMSKNFIQLNSRLSFPFQLIDSIIKFFNWDNPNTTISILIIATNIILNPIPILSSFPFFYIILYVMVPAYESRHPPETNTILGKNNPVLSVGPNLKNYEPPKPASELSQEFILNLTDLQNHMILYVDLWNFIVKNLSRFAFFNDDSISSFYYLVLLSLGTVLYFSSDLIISILPIKIILIASIWSFVISLHPHFKDSIYEFIYSEKTRLYWLKKNNKLETFIENNFEFSEPQEQREVEIFEIQKFNPETKEWTLLFFANDEFTKISDSRLSIASSSNAGGSNASSTAATTSNATNATTTSTTNSTTSTTTSTTTKNLSGPTNINSIKPPKDWDFLKNDHWKIDLNPKVWVKTHFIIDLVSIDEETKWVYDIKQDNSNENNENEQEPEQELFRRRRWTRTVTRFSELQHMNDSKTGNDNDTKTANS